MSIDRQIILTFFEILGHWVSVAAFLYIGRRLRNIIYGFVSIFTRPIIGRVSGFISVSGNVYPIIDNILEMIPILIAENFEPSFSVKKRIFYVR